MCLYMPADMKYWGFDKLSEYCHEPYHHPLTIPILTRILEPCHSLFMTTLTLDHPGREFEMALHRITEGHESVIIKRGKNHCRDDAS